MKDKVTGCTCKLQTDDDQTDKLKDKIMDEKNQWMEGSVNTWMYERADE